MCSSLVSALLEYLASVKCDSTFLKWIWGLIKRTCICNKCVLFWFFFVLILFINSPSLLWLRKIKTSQIRKPTQYMIQAQFSKFWVAEFSRCGSKWDGPAPHWEDLALSGVCSPYHHPTGAQLCSYGTLRQALAVTGQLTPGNGWY